MSIKIRVYLLTLVAIFAVLGMWLIFSYILQTNTHVHNAFRYVEQGESFLLTLRQHEKDFLSLHDLAYQEKFKQDTQSLHQKLDELAQQLAEIHIDGQEVLQLHQHLEDYAKSFSVVVTTQTEVGLNEKSGLLGHLREAVHNAESTMKEFKDDRLLKDMLMLRRHEKDFLQRMDLKYQEKFEKDFAVFSKDLAASALEASVKTLVQEKMDLYKRDFNSLIAGYQKKGLTFESGVRGEMLKQATSMVETFQQVHDSISKAGLEVENHLRLVGILAVLLFATFIIGLGVGLAWSIIRPIKSAVNRMEDIASGSGDLTVKLSANTQDEVGQLGKAFNIFIEKIRHVVAQTAGASVHLASAAEENSRIAEETNHAIVSERQEIGSVLQTISHISESVNTVALHARDAVESANQAVDTVQSGQKVVRDSVHTIKVLANEVESATQVVQTLSETSRDIGGVLNVIQGIAEQTNLLALNAAIEAARAGESGRGFAVVADEVRTLASRTQKSTEEIQQMIERLQSGVARAVQVMGSNTRRAAEGVDQVNRTDESLSLIIQSIGDIHGKNKLIAQATESQSVAAKKINDNVSSIMLAMEHLGDCSQQGARTSEELARLAEELQQLTQQFCIKAA